MRDLIPCGKQTDPKQYEGSTKHHDLFYSGESERIGALRCSQSAILDAEELNNIGTFVRDTAPDIEVPAFPPKHKLEVHQTFTSFIQKVFWQAVRKGWLIVCFNSPFDLSRLSRSFRPDKNRDGFSLIMGLRCSLRGEYFCRLKTLDLLGRDDLSKKPSLA